ncbi:Uncharacterised protein at_DN2261 [Pycnogonum litorale]
MRTGGFSLLKQIKSDWRNRLLDTTVSDLIRIKLDTPEIKDYKPSAAIHLWNTSSSHGRQLNHRQHSVQHIDSESDSDNWEDLNELFNSSTDSETEFLGF